MRMRFAALGALSRKTFAIAAAAAFLAAPSTAVRADDAAQALLAKHKAYAGWSFNDGTFKTLTTQWTLSHTKDGSVVYRETEREMGVLERSDYVSERSGRGGHEGFTGTLLWQSGSNGFTTRLLGDPAKFLVSLKLIFDEAATQASGTLEPAQIIDGKSYGVVRVKIDASLPVDLYIDQATGAYRRAVLDPGGGFERTYNFLDTMEALPGKKLISRYTVGGWTGALEKATANEPIEPSQLAPPPPTARWSFGNGGAIPIHVTDKRIFVTAKVNGVEGHFFLDTGAGDIFLSTAFAKRANVDAGEKVTGRGLGGTFESTVRTIKTISMGDNTLSNVVVTAAPFDGFGEEGKDGLVGFDLFAGALVVLNLDDSTLTILDPTKMQPDTSAGIPVLVDLSSQQPVVPMKLNGAVEVQALLDSGDPLHVLLDRALITNHNLKFLIDRSSLASEELGGGLGSTYQMVECGKLQSLSLGPISYNSPPACVGQATFGSPSDRDVIVGFDFLKHFNIVFDYPAGMMLFQQRKNEPK